MAWLCVTDPWAPQCARLAVQRRRATLHYPDLRRAEPAAAASCWGSECSQQFQSRPPHAWRRWPSWTLSRHSWSQQHQSRHCKGGEHATRVEHTDLVCWCCVWMELCRTQQPSHTNQLPFPDLRALVKLSMVCLCSFVARIISIASDCSIFCIRYATAVGPDSDRDNTGSCVQVHLRCLHSRSHNR